MPTQQNAGADGTATATIDVELESGKECQVWSDRKLIDKEQVLLLRSDDGGSNYDHRDKSQGADGILLNPDKASNSFRGPGFFRISWVAADVYGGNRTIYADN